MKPEYENVLEMTYEKLVFHRTEMGRLIESLNALLPESDRFYVETVQEALDKLITEARERAIRAVLEPYKNTNVRINVEEISKELEKLCGKTFSAYHVKAIFGIHYHAAKDSLKNLLFEEAGHLLPWKIETPEQLVKGVFLILRHSVTESKYGGSPDGMWQFEGRLSRLEKLIRIRTQDADPRTVLGDTLSLVYRANKNNPWDKFILNDPVFVSSKLYKNGKFELELTSMEKARNTAAFLFTLAGDSRG